MAQQQNRPTQPDQPTLGPVSADTPAGTASLAAQLVDLVRSDPSVALAIGEALSSTADGRQMLGISGKPRARTKKPDSSAVKQFVAAYGEVTREEGFLPAPPEGIVAKGPHAVRVWQEAWKEGRHISPFDDEQLSEGGILASHN